MIVVLIGITILKRPETEIPARLQSNLIHLLLLYVSFMIGATVWMTTFAARSGQYMDMYHDLVIVVLFIYMAMILFQVVLKHGTKIEKITIICLVLAWLSLAAFDNLTGKINQRDWLQKHGVVFKQ